MNRRKSLSVTIATALLGFAVPAGAATPVVRSPMEFPWGANEHDVQSAYPPESNTSLKARYGGPLELMDERMGWVLIRFSFTKREGLQRTKVSMSPDSWHRLVATLEREYGNPRYGFTRANSVFTHYLEWSAGEVGITASISTIGEHLKGPLYARDTGTIAFARGSMRSSVIDYLDKSRSGARLQKE